MRLMPNQSPLPIPCRAIACAMYSEQVGVKRQMEGVWRETRW
jgi:hypothetical protein